MADTQEILKKADELGQLIADHPASVKLSDHLAKLKADTDAQRTLTDYQRHMDTLREKQSSGKPIEVADKRKMEELQLTLAKHPLLRDLQMVQMDYVDLVRKVDEAIQRHGVMEGESEG